MDERTYRITVEEMHDEGDEVKCVYEGASFVVGVLQDIDGECCNLQTGYVGSHRNINNLINSMIEQLSNRGLHLTINDRLQLTINDRKDDADE